MAEPNSANKIRLDLVMQIVAWVVGVMVVYGALNARVSVLETKYDGVKEQLSLINLKLDRLMDHQR